MGDDGGRTGMANRYGIVLRKVRGAIARSISAFRRVVDIADETRRQGCRRYNGGVESEKLGKHLTGSVWVSELRGSDNL